MHLAACRPALGPTDLKVAAAVYDQILAQIEEPLSDVNRYRIARLVMRSALRSAKRPPSDLAETCLRDPFVSARLRR